MPDYEPTKSGNLFQEWRISLGYFKPKDLTQAFNSHSHGISEYMVVNVETGKNLINPAMLEFFYKTGKMSQTVFEAILAARKEDEKDKWEKKNGKKAPGKNQVTEPQPVEVVGKKLVEQPEEKKEPEKEPIVIPVVTAPPPKIEEPLKVSRVASNPPKPVRRQVSPFQWPKRKDLAILLMVSGLLWIMVWLMYSDPLYGQNMASLGAIGLFGGLALYLKSPV